MLGSRMESISRHTDDGEAPIAQVTLSIGHFRVSIKTHDHGGPAANLPGRPMRLRRVDEDAGVRLPPRP